MKNLVGNGLLIFSCFKNETTQNGFKQKTLKSPFKIDEVGKEGGTCKNKS